MRLGDDLVRRVARLERYGFSPAQARALIEAGLGVVGVADITQLFFGVDACNSRPVIRGGAQ